ncbi:MAG: thioredoxin family protein [Chthoniobacteraceae bacterium]
MPSKLATDRLPASFWAMFKRAKLIFLLLSVFSLVLPAMAGWTEDYSAAVITAKNEKKLLLLNFMGSDWCAPCNQLEKEVYSTTTFEEYATKHLILVKVDFPLRSPQAEAVKQQNAKLQAQYGVLDLPVAVLTDSEGKKLGQIFGYIEGGPTAFIKELEKIAGDGHFTAR